MPGRSSLFMPQSILKMHKGQEELLLTRPIADRQNLGDMETPKIRRIPDRCLADTTNWLPTERQHGLLLRPPLEGEVVAMASMISPTPHLGAEALQVNPSMREMGGEFVVASTNPCTPHLEAAALRTHASMQASCFHNMARQQRQPSLVARMSATTGIDETLPWPRSVDLFESCGKLSPSAQRRGFAASLPRQALHGSADNAAHSKPSNRGGVRPGMSSSLPSLHNPETCCTNFPEKPLQAGFAQNMAFADTAQTCWRHPMSTTTPLADNERLRRRRPMSAPQCGADKKGVMGHIMPNLAEASPRRRLRPEWQC